MEENKTIMTTKKCITENRRYWTLSQASFYFGINRATLQHWINYFGDFRTKMDRGKKKFSQKDMNILEAIYFLRFIHKMRYNLFQIKQLISF